MLFNSWTFVLFALVVFPLYYLLSHRFQNFMLLGASYLFYGAWDYRFLVLIFLSTVVDYYLSLRIATATSNRVRGRYLVFSCIANLGLLGFFKYYGFFITNAETLLATLGFQSDIPYLRVVLPLGISFYTFQTLSYTIDVYRGRIQPTRSFLNYALYVAYFPQLVAGPIERAERLLPQIEGARKVLSANITSGCWLILWGFFKKIVIADNLAVVVDRAFGGGATPGGLECLVAVYAFAFQIYCDFSGYSDIARGLSSLFGIDIMKNFQLPYMARNPREFWQRWHISLSTWLRDYLYCSLGGNRGGPWKTYRNLLVTMVLGGLWHGAGWTFVAWGFFHGAILVVHRLFVGKNFKNSNGPSNILGDCLKRVGMFHMICLGWLLFRADSLTQVLEFLVAIFGGIHITPETAVYLMPTLLFVGLLCVIEGWIKNSDRPDLCPGWNRVTGPLTCSLLVVLMVTLSPPAGQFFIYFQF